MLDQYTSTTRINKKKNKTQLVPERPSANFYHYKVNSYKGLKIAYY